jgi:hypothetical protein
MFVDVVQSSKGLLACMGIDETRDGALVNVVWSVWTLHAG